VTSSPPKGKGTVSRLSPLRVKELKLAAEKFLGLQRSIIGLSATKEPGGGGAGAGSGKSAPPVWKGGA